MFIVSMVIICVSIGCMVEVIYQNKKMRENYELRLSVVNNDLLKAREENQTARAKITTLEGQLRNLQIDYENSMTMRNCRVTHTEIPTIMIESTVRDTNVGWQRECGLCFTADEIKEKLVLNMVPDLMECLEISEVRDLCANELVTHGLLRVAKKD